jgi:hypothetical protein
MTISGYCNNGLRPLPSAGNEPRITPQGARRTTDTCTSVRRAPDSSSFPQQVKWAELLDAVSFPPFAAIVLTAGPKSLVYWIPFSALHD